MAQYLSCAIIAARWHFMVETVVLGESGRIVLPVAIRRELGLKTGDRLTVTNDGRSIRILTRKMALESMQADILRHRCSLSGVVDEFIAERRSEAARELKESVRG
jgi:AbrB family looped-hinge helix DNA binding protein